MDMIGRTEFWWGLHPNYAARRHVAKRNVRMKTKRAGEAVTLNLSLDSKCSGVPLTGTDLWVLRLIGYQLAFPFWTAGFPQLARDTPELQVVLKG